MSWPTSWLGWGCMTKPRRNSRARLFSRMARSKRDSPVAALSGTGASVAAQQEEPSDSRARARGQGGTPDVPDAPRNALSGLLRGRIEDLAGLALFNLDKPDEAVAHLLRAVSVSPEGTPL